MQKKIGRAIDSDVAPPRMSRLYVLSFLQNDKKKKTDKYVILLLR